MALKAEVLTVLKDTALAWGSLVRPTAWSEGRDLESGQPSLGPGLGVSLHICTPANLYRYGCETLELGPFCSQTRTSFICLDSLSWQGAYLDILSPVFSFFLQVNADKDRSLLLDWDRVRVFDREIAQMFLNMTKLEKEAQVGLPHPHLSRSPWLGVDLGSL